MHLEALDEVGRRILFKLGDFPGFYLAGGTALALQIGHRQSVDFDLFQKDALPRDLSRRIEKTFSGNTAVVSVDNADELTVFVEGMKVSFLRYPFPALLPLVKSDGVRLLSVGELAATKAYTIGRRGSLKDYVDLYWTLSEKHATLKEIVELAEEKYKNEFNARLFLEQLVYLEDVEEAPIVFLGEAVTKEEMKRFFEDAIQKADLL